METWALPEIDEETCHGCGDRADACRASAVSIVDGKAAVTQAGACEYWTDCEAACPVEAIRCPFEIAWA